MSSSYFTQLEATVDGVIASLTAKKIKPIHLKFGEVAEKAIRKPRVPTDARSEFLANRAMGNWAESQLAAGLTAIFPKWKVVQYGITDKIAAGHPDFKNFYLKGLEETRLYGKRPDLLLFPSISSVNSDLSAQSHAETVTHSKQAIASIEVRSSKYDALTYMAVRSVERQSGKSGGRETPNFTVKVEDLVIVFRWLQQHDVPQSYFQVFFDSIFAINFLDIFSIIASGDGYLIEKPANSQEKATIMIPITRGLKVGKATSTPAFTAEHHVTRLGRHDAYVKPIGGGFELDADEVRKVLMPREDA